MPRGPKKIAKPEKKVTRYTYGEMKEPRMPETGHTALLPADEQVVTLLMDNGWSKAIEVGKLPEGNEYSVVVNMDPAADPVFFWAGKRNKREVPVLPLQRNEIVTDSRIAQIIDRTRKAAAEKEPQARQGSLFADLEKTLREKDRSKRVEFYTHEEGWKNKLICGDSLHVMESLLHYENLRGKVQMIYIDPPYGIKYDSNFQQRVDSTGNDDKDTADDVLTIKAFRDTWSLGVHSYLSYLEERLYLARELLSETGSLFLQISDENIHRVRILLDEVFGASQFVAQIAFTKTTGLTSTKQLASRCDYLLWYGRSSRYLYEPIYEAQDPLDSGFGRIEIPSGERRTLTKEERSGAGMLPSEGRLYMADNLTKPGPGAKYSVLFEGAEYDSGNRWWGMPKEALESLIAAGRVELVGKTLRYVRYFEDFPYKVITNLWLGFAGASDPAYVVQTNEDIVARCILMTTKPGDIVFDPTCGSGTTSRAAERLGRRWITCDTSRVAVNVARRELLKSLFDHFVTQNGSASSGFKYVKAARITPTTIAYGREPESVELVHRPERDPAAIRVCGPFEVMSLGRYSVEDWKGYVVREHGIGEAAKLENYIEVICRLYRKDAAIQGATGLVHAIVETAEAKIAISVGPLSARVTAKQINDAVQDALASGILEVHVLGWAFEANVGEVKSQLETRGKVKVELIMIRPDTLADGLKAIQPEMLFSPLALPDIEVKLKKNGKDAVAIVTLNGVALFDRKHRRTEYKHAKSGYVSAWYLDEDYDGDCFVDSQMFFEFKKAPNLRTVLEAEVDPEEYKLQLSSQPFPVRGYKRIAVKVVDVYGNESTIVSKLA
jgi:adenine-specific DNA-methyltransferase